MKTISDYNFEGKTVLLRSDLNSDVVKNKVLESERIKESAITIKELLKKKAKVVILAHQGNPGKSDFTSLKKHSEYLNKYVKVKFIPKFLSDRSLEEIKRLKKGEALLLDNVRQSKDEFIVSKNNEILKKLIPLADVYVNDAFSVCHRKQTSIIGIPKHLPSFMGRLLEKEVKALRKININETLFILGGAKPEDNIKLLKAKKILTCGLFGQLCLIANGKDLGAQNKYLEKEKILTKDILKKLKWNKVVTPIDFAVKVNGERKELSLDEFPSKYEIFDIGSKTIGMYKKEIRNAKSIYMKGPAGFCADEKFCKGTNSILKEISKTKAFSLIGGGHLSDAIAKSKINKKSFNHISLSGGALLSYVAGEMLPGLEVLKRG